MPYSKIAELPPAVRERYSPRCQKVFMDAFNRAVSAGGIGGALSEEKAFKVAHTAAGLCKDSGKAEPMKAQALDTDEMSAWFDGRIPRRLLVIPFSGPIKHPRSEKGIDMDAEWFDKASDIMPDLFERRPSDWHHSQDPTGLLNGAMIGWVDRLGTEKGELGAPDDYGWWADFWFKAGERRIDAIRQLNAKGAELFGSSYAYPPLVKRDAKSGHIDRWPYMMQTLSTSPQNTHSIHRPAKAVLDLFDQADISVESAMKAMLAELDVLRSFPASFPIGGEQAAKAEAEESEFAEWMEVLAGTSRRAAAFVSTLKKPEDVSSN